MLARNRAERAPPLRQTKAGAKESKAHSLKAVPLAGLKPRTYNRESGKNTGLKDQPLQREGFQE